MPEGIDMQTLWLSYKCAENSSIQKALALFLIHFTHTIAPLVNVSFWIHSHTWDPNIYELNQAYSLHESDWWPLLWSSSVPLEEEMDAWRLPVPPPAMHGFSQACNNLRTKKNKQWECSGNKCRADSKLEVDSLKQQQQKKLHCCVGFVLFVFCILHRFETRRLHTLFKMTYNLLFHTVWH